MTHFTTIKQSQALIEAGLNPDTADMYYREWKRATKLISIAHVGKYGKDDMPCWSTGALIELLPKAIFQDGIFYKLITFHNMSVIQYCNLDKDKVLNTEVWNTIDPKTQGYVYGLIKMVLWCLENGYIEKKGE